MKEEVKKKEPKPKKKPNIIIEFANEPSPEAVERMHRVIYEILVNRLEREYGHR